MCPPEILWEKLGKVHVQSRHLVSVTSGNTYEEAPDPSNFLAPSHTQKRLPRPSLKDLHKEVYLTLWPLPTGNMSLNP